jgi:hypothetical protein
MLINIASCNILGDCQQQIIAATESQLAFAQGSLDSSNPPYDFVMFHMPWIHVGDGGTTWAAFATLVTGLPFPERLLRHNDDQHARACHLMGFGHSDEDNTIRQDISGALGYSVGQVGVPTTALMVTSLHYRAGWTRGRRWSARLDRPRRIRGPVGCFCRHESRRALEERQPFSKSTLAAASLMPFWCTTGKVL